MKINKSPAMLTPRELEVIGLLASGCTYLEVSERLGVSVHTTTTHIKNLYRKLDAHTAASAVMRAVELRLLAVLEPGSVPGVASFGILAGPRQ